MKKLMVAALAVSFVAFAFADSASDNASGAEKPAAAQEEEEEDSLFEVGFDADFTLRS